MTREAADPTAGDAWGRALICACCFAPLRKLNAAGRPPKYCDEKSCLLKAQRRRRKKKREQARDRKLNSGRCLSCGELLAVPHRKGCEARG